MLTLEASMISGAAIKAMMSIRTLSLATASISIPIQAIGRRAVVFIHSLKEQLTLAISKRVLLMT
jgi:hypothetical protein